jgi:hypothetical protein
VADEDEEDMEEGIDGGEEENSAKRFSLDETVLEL